MIRHITTSMKEQRGMMADRGTPISLPEEGPPSLACRRAVPGRTSAPWPWVDSHCHESMGAALWSTPRVIAQGCGARRGLQGKGISGLL